MICVWEGQAWCSGEKPSHWAYGPGLDAASLQNAGVRLALVIPSPDPTHVGAASPGLSYDMCMPLVDLSWTRTEFQNITPKIITKNYVCTHFNFPTTCHLVQWIPFGFQIWCYCFCWRVWKFEARSGHISGSIKELRCWHKRGNLSCKLEWIVKGDFLMKTSLDM